MGCGASTSKRSIVSSPPPSNTLLNSKRTPLTASQIESRIESPNEAQTVTLPSNHLKLNYAWVSQRGYYPDAPDKENQDSFSILPVFGSNSDMSFFGVFDGHGKDGHLASWFARDKLQKNIAGKIGKMKMNVTPKAIKQALTLAHLETNEQMHNCKGFDDALSGTTSISVLIREERLYVSNVGDSRAIIVSTQSDGRLVAKPLSADQTPYRKDERERVKKYGARILSMDQIEGIEPVHENWGDINLGVDIDEGGDPPRIWSYKGDYPGTAFSRSFGDRVAEELGVTAEPEILERDLHSSDKFIVIASDGVFEFLTNQMVADMVSQHTDPLAACKSIVASAYELWLQYEVRTDDITIIVMFIEHNTLSIDESKSDITTVSTTQGTTTSQIELLDREGPRPVRRALSREKKKNMILQANTEIENDDDFEMESLVIPKNEEDTKAITGAIKSNFLFQHLNSTQRAAIINVMMPVITHKGEWVITQGDLGDRFYVVDSGTYEVRVKSPTSTDDQTDGGNVVHVYESGIDQHPGFGELSLMYDKPRAASVIALTEGKLWSLDRRIFKKVVMRSMDARKDIIRTLRKVELLKCLSLQQVQRLADLLNEDTFETGDYIIRQGEVGENFYLIVSGNADCTINGKDDEPQKVVLQLKDNDYFGERALLNSAPRAANVIARANIRVLYIGKSAFEEVLGPLSIIIDEDRKKRESLANEIAIRASCQEKLIVTMVGHISTDNLGPLLLGTFGDVKPNVCIRTFILSEVQKLSLSGAVAIFIEAARLITVNKCKSEFVPNLISIYRVNNAVHLAFGAAVVADLSSIIKSISNEGTMASSPEILTYVAANLVAGIECIHQAGIIYRAIQPESLCVNASGRVIFCDFRVCKIGGIGAKSFTICGASDYLAPEQISQRGHGGPVDLWALGVLLYELATGLHPFSANSEVATYAKITSFGSKSYPELFFPETALPLPEIKSLINKLLMPTPEARIGSGNHGISALKKHPLFNSINWSELDRQNSPMSIIAALEYDEVIRDGIDKNLLASFDDINQNIGGWIDDIDITF